MKHRNPALKNFSVRKPLIVLLLAVVFALAGGVMQPAQAASCTATNGQFFIDSGQYKKAVQEFSCVIDGDPTAVDGYRGRIEAQLMLGQYSDALSDYARVTAVVLPVHPGAAGDIFAGYAERLSANPDSIPALTGESFAYWWSFKYASAIHTLNHLLEVDPNNVYGSLFRGSSRLLHGSAVVKGTEDIEKAISLAPNNPDVRFIVADAYTYGVTDPQRAFAEASLALNGGLNTPRIHAILASAYMAFGDPLAAAQHIKLHIDMVSSETVTTAPLSPAASLSLNLAPGRTFAIPVPAVAGETIDIMTGSGDFWDTIAVLLNPEGNPVVGSDDARFYFAAFDWQAEETGTYMLLVTSFESINTGSLTVTRD